MRCWLRLVLVLSSCVSCGARTALDSTFGDEQTNSAWSPSSSVPASPPALPSAGSPPGAVLPSTATLPSIPEPSQTAPSDSSEPAAEIPYDDPFVPVPELPPVVIMGKSQAESPYFHPRPTDDALRFYVNWLEYGEGMPYPYRPLEWTFLGGPHSGPVAVGPKDEIYAWSDDELTGLQYQVARYTPELGWLAEALPIPEGTSFDVNDLDVASNGVAWAATNVGLFTRTDAQWRPATGWDPNYPRVGGVSASAEGNVSVAFLDYDAFATDEEGDWTRIDRNLPPLIHSSAFSRSWINVNAGVPGLLAISSTDVTWQDPQNRAKVYPLRAKDGGFGPAGELLIVGATALLVSTGSETWHAYPIQLGGARGGDFTLDEISVAPAGDAYISGVSGGMFHRFPDRSMELFNVPEDMQTHDANDRILVVRDHDGVWQATPRAGISTSGVFEAVVPESYRGNNFLSSSIVAVSISDPPEPPTCFDIDLSSSTGSQVSKVSPSEPKRFRFKAPETGVFQFRLSRRGNVRPRYDAC